MIDEHSETWRQVSRWVEEQLKACLESVVVPGEQERVRDHFVGRYSVLEDLLKLPAQMRDRGE